MTHIYVTELTSKPTAYKHVIITPTRGFDVIITCLLRFVFAWWVNGLSSVWWSHYYLNQYQLVFHDDIIKWKYFPRYWPFVRGQRIHRTPVNSHHKGQWRGALIFFLICAWINDLVNNREAGDLRCYRAHHDVIVMHLDPEKLGQWCLLAFKTNRLRTRPSTPTGKCCHFDENFLTICTESATIKGN